MNLRIVLSRTFGSDYNLISLVQADNHLQPKLKIIDLSQQ
jgi:hypothetical protein